jgi:2-isopropylmalate synthase
VGRSAFAHKGGVHGAATARVERSYQHIDPGLVGNVSRLVVSELGGKANTQLRAEQLGHRLQGVDPRQLSQLIKQLESDGLAFEGAEASFELLVRRHSAAYAAPFRLVDFTVLVEQRGGAELLAEATVEVDGETLHTAADGNGPVNALDAALRKALGAFYPQLDAVHLVDYKVRILDGDSATAARTRVIIDSSDGVREWSTMGSDTNIIAASCAALSDSLEYAIWKTGAELRRRDERHFTTLRPGPANDTPSVVAEAVHDVTAGGEAGAEPIPDAIPGR